MNTRDTTTVYFQGTPNVAKLFRALWEVMNAWTAARRYQSVDFRQENENELTPEIKTSIDAARHASDEDFVNI